MQQPLQHLRGLPDLRIVPTVQKLGVEEGQPRIAVLHALDCEHVGFALGVEAGLDLQSLIAQFGR